MKILYAIQATGNGHIMRAKEHIPALKKVADVDILTSGNLSDIDLGHEIKYKFRGLSFQYNDKGGLSYWKTLLNMKFVEFYRDIKKLDLSEYDFVISDFEPVSAWACKIQKKLCISSSHQRSFSSSKTPRPKFGNEFSEFVFKHYAPSKVGIGFHYKSYDNFILEPQIRKAIKDSVPTNKGHYIVYLGAYSVTNIYEVLSNFTDKTFYVFTKEFNSGPNFLSRSLGNVHFLPMDVQDFTEKFISCEGIITAGGFETTSEALYLGKKALVIPIEGQYEQECNAAALKQDFTGQCITVNYLKRKHVKKLIESEMPARVMFNDGYSYTDKIMGIFSKYGKN